MQAEQGPGAERRGRRTLLAYATLAAVIAVVHFGALFDETRHDDHLHRENLRELGWGWNDLIESTTFELPGRQMHLWWQEQPIQWRYPRPIAMVILKAEFTLASGDPFVLHLFGLAWHWLNCILVYHLAFWMLRSVAWSVVAGGLFAIGPHAAVAASWTAAHNVLTSNALLLAAMLLYARCTLAGDAKPRAPQSWALPAAIICWMAALFAREAAIVFPLLAAGLELCFGGFVVLRRRWRVHLVMLGVAAAYVAWRLLVFPRGAMPAGYMTTPTGIEYVGWALSKYAQSIGVFLLQLPLYVPLDYFARWTPTMIATHIGLLAVIALVAVVYARGIGGGRGRWFGPLWILIALLPVVPIATSPHFAYAPFVGYAVAAAAFLRQLAPRRRRAIALATIAFLGGMFALQRYMIRMQLRTEQLVLANIRESAPQPRPVEGSTLFFIDLPVSTMFSTFALRESWGLSDLTGYALTTSYVHEARGPTRIERIGDRTLELSCAAPGWFSQIFDRWLLKLGGRSGPPTAGSSAKTEWFDVTVIESDGVGVTRIRFDFHDTLDRPDWLFFAAGPDWPMQRLRLNRPADPAADAVAAAEFQARHAGWLAERNPLFALRRWLWPQAR